jgi:hypothetical protein
MKYDGTGVMMSCPCSLCQNVRGVYEGIGCELRFSMSDAVLVFLVFPNQRRVDLERAGTEISDILPWTL